MKSVKVGILGAAVREETDMFPSDVKNMSQTAVQTVVMAEIWLMKLLVLNTR